MNRCAVADTSPELVHDSYPGMHLEIDLTRLDVHREKLTLQQAPSTYTDVQTKTISVPITEVCSNRDNQRLNAYMVLPLTDGRDLTNSCSGFHVLRGTQHHHPVLNPARLDRIRLLDNPVRIHQHHHLSSTWSHSLRNIHLHQRRADTHGYAAQRSNPDHSDMLHPYWSRFSSVDTHSDQNSAWRDVHQLRLAVLRYTQTDQTPSYDYIDTHVARCHFHELLHGSWIQPLRRPYFCRHSHNFRTDDCANSPRRPNDFDRIPDHNPSRFDLHRTRRQAHADRVRH
jgi:hypothetical protein